MPSRGSLARSRRPMTQLVGLGHRPLRPQTLCAKPQRHAGGLFQAPSPPKFENTKYRLGSPPRACELSHLLSTGTTHQMHKTTILLLHLAPADCSRPCNLRRETKESQPQPALLFLLRDRDHTHTAQETKKTTLVTGSLFVARITCRGAHNRGHKMSTPLLPSRAKKMGVINHPVASS